MPTIHIPQGSPADVRRSETQGMLVLSSVPAAESQALIGKSLFDAGELAVEGTYSCEIDTHDWAAFDVILMPSAVTGSITPVVHRMYANKQMIRSTTTGVASVADTAQVISVTTVTGTQRFRVDIAVPNGGSITYAPGDDPTDLAALAEYNGA